MVGDFQRLQQNRLITKGSKCEFLKTELEFLRHVISTEGVKIDPRKIQAIQEWKPPTNLRELQSFAVHDSNLSGHFGLDKSLKALQPFYYRPDMISDVQKYVGACPTCQTMKSSCQRLVGLLQPLEPPQQPWQHVTMDFVISLPAGPRGNDAVLVVVDRLTKMAHFAPCRTMITAEETARLFISVVVRLHGIPTTIISDRDSKFTPRFWQDTWNRYGTHLQFSSAYHPQTNDQTERTNQTMEQFIRTNCPDISKREDSLPMLELPTTTHPLPRPIIRPSS
ncbi:hypothetical protein CLOM_g17634 [Closterium sp. NIES-68]|nr:hypothetical protein CLOM_g17634 [Closterium sp. NIES-68]